MSFLASLEHNAAQRPDEPARIFLSRDGEERARVTHRELRDRVRALRDRLAAEFSPGEIVLLAFEPGLEFTITFFGCLSLGLETVPVPPLDTSRANPRLEYLKNILEQVDSKTVLSSGKSAVLLAERDIRTLDLSGREPVDNTPLEASTDAVATLLFTSGSTSEPKGVPLRHAQMFANAVACCKRWDLNAQSIMASWMPDHHSFGLIYNLLLPAISGGCLVAMAPSDFIARPRAWLEMVDRFRCTHGAAAVFGYQQIIEQMADEDLNGLDLSSWRVGLISAEPVRKGVCKGFLKRLRPAGLDPSFFCALYGLSEAGPVTSMPVSAQSLFREEAGIPDHLQTACLGEPLDGARVLIVDDRGHPLQENQPGEVWIASNSLMDGYFRNEAADKECFGYVRGRSERFFRTGDRGFLRDGHLYLTGRIKEIMIVRGRNFYPVDLECLAREADPSLGNGKAAAFGIDSGHGEEITVVVEVGESNDLGSLARKAVEAIADTLGLRINRLVLTRLGGIPTTASGKIQRAACREALARGELTLLYDTRARLSQAQTETDIETLIRRRFAEALHLEMREMEPDRPLSDFEIDSMTFTELARILSEDLARIVHPADFYSVETLAELIRSLEGSGP